MNTLGKLHIQRLAHPVDEQPEVRGGVGEGGGITAMLDDEGRDDRDTHPMGHEVIHNSRRRFCTQTRLMKDSDKSRKPRGDGPVDLPEGRGKYSADQPSRSPGANHITFSSACAKHEPQHDPLLAQGSRILIGTREVVSHEDDGGRFVAGQDRQQGRDLVFAHDDQNIVVGILRLERVAETASSASVSKSMSSVPMPARCRTWARTSSISPCETASLSTSITARA
jgi:hypothetical protein